MKTFIIFYFMVLFVGAQLQPIQEENITELNTENPQIQDDKDLKLDEETKSKCKYYYELFEQKLKELQEKQPIEGSNKNIDHKNIDSKNSNLNENSRTDQETSQSINKSNIKVNHYNVENLQYPYWSYLEANPNENFQNKKGFIPQSINNNNKYDVKVNNFDVQNLPYPERSFFNPNPDKNLPKQNSKGPIPQTSPIFIHNGYQYVPLDTQYNVQNYLQPPLETKPMKFNNEKYMNLSPLTLQNSLVSDGKMVYFWYKTSPNYQVYLPINNQYVNNNEKLSEIDENTEKPTISTTTTSSSTTTTESTTSTTTETITSTESNVEDVKPNSYEHQLKFVFPIQFPKPEVVNIPAYDIGVDPYAYYPRELQPEFVNLQLPYVPTFHMIKQLTVPHNHKIDTSIEDDISNPSL